MSDRFIRQLEIGPMQNFVYLVGDRASGEAAVVDPAWDAPQLLKEAEALGCRITHVVLTHGHFDHVNALEPLLEATDATVCAQAVEVEHFIPEGGGGLVIPRAVFKRVVSGDSLRIGGLRLEFLPTPGHTPGSQCIRLTADDFPAPAVLTGDTLFMGACGRSDFPYSDPEALYHSLERLKRLSADTVIYPGHDYGATVSNPMGEERRTNPFLLADSLDRFLDMTGRRRRRGI